MGKNYKIVCILRGYNFLKVKIEDIKLQLEEIEKYEVMGVSAIDYSKNRTGRKYKYNSIVENQAIDIAEKKKLLKTEIIRLQTMKQRIDNAIQTLDDEEKTIIKKRYMCKQKWHIIARTLCSSERNVIYKAEGALEKIENLLFGGEELHEKYRNNL